MNLLVAKHKPLSLREDGTYPWPQQYNEILLKWYPEVLRDKACSVLELPLNARVETGQAEPA